MSDSSFFKPLLVLDYNVFNKAHQDGGHLGAGGVALGHQHAV